MVSGPATLSGGAAVALLFTLDGVSLARVATSAKYTDLVAQPRIYLCSADYAVTAGGAPKQPANISFWYGTVATPRRQQQQDVNNLAVATAYVTPIGMYSGQPLFSFVLSVNGNVLGGSASAFAWVIGICSV